jgi:hypothetical protein
VTAFSIETTPLGPFLDCAGPESVEVEITEAGVLYVHVDGCTVLRIQRAGDMRIQEDTWTRLVARWHATARGLRDG